MMQFLSYGVQGLRSKAQGLVAGWFLAFAGPAAADQIDILALGDSLIQGYGLVESDGFVPQMQRWLDARGHMVHLINGGVSGDTTAGALSRIEWSLTPEVDAVIVAFGGNDVLRGITPETARANIHGILEIAAARNLPVLLVPTSVPGNYGADYKQDFDAIYPELAAEYGAIATPTFLDFLLEDGEEVSQIAGLLQRDGIHPNVEGVARIVDQLGPYVEQLIGAVE